MFWVNSEVSPSPVTKSGDKQLNLNARHGSGSV
jgi:hypothetical protein